MDESLQRYRHLGGVEEEKMQQITTFDTPSTIDLLRENLSFSLI